ncbi:3557_t:CDS:2, partial [Gigaspora margarita]
SEKPYKYASFALLYARLISQTKMNPLVFTHPEEKHFTFDKIPDLTGKLKPVKECAENFLARNLPLHILTFSLTEDGIQEEFGVSHVGHFFLTKLLLQKIKASQPARIVNVSNIAHSLVTGIEFETLNDPNAQDLKQRYRQSNILFTDEFNRRYLEGEQVYANSLHPGLVDTPMLRRNDLSFSETLVSSSISPEDGAITTLYCATSPEIEEKNYRGRYFVPFGIEGEKSSYAEDDDLPKRLGNLLKI